jgi:DNA polymerase
MPLTERRVAMLREMRIAYWQPPAPAPAPSAATDTARATVAAPAPAPARAPIQAPVQAPVQAPARAPASDALAAPVAAPVRAPAAPLSILPAAVAAMDWPDLREAVARCQACALGATRQQTVFGVGSPRAHWMIVGEAPGEQEDLRGEPFVGAAGQLLDAMLRAIGLTRADDPALEPATQVYITNTLKCRPPRNRNPEREEMARCEPYLVRQIELLQPRLILAMGRFAVQSLLRTEDPIGRLRGRVHRYQGVPVVVTYHPAYLLRNLPDKAKAWEDLCLALQTMASLPLPAGDATGVG